MDTRFWGPSGWRLLHLISVSDAARRHPAAVKEWFELIAFVLPCKFCRASYAQYIEEDPVPSSAAALPKWLWALHNKVNAKLRSQKLPTAPDPPFHSVLLTYKERLGMGCTRTEFEGWDFLFAIAENHPLSRSGRNSHPMPDTPKEIIGARDKGGQVADDKEANRWNILSPERRLFYYRKFWALLPSVLPYPEWEAAWRRAPGANRAAEHRATSSRPLLLRWLWKRRCAMESSLELLNRSEFHQVCSRLRNARSGCGAKRRAKTCRRQMSPAVGGAHRGGKRQTRRR